MRKEFIFLVVVAVFLIFAFTPTAPVVSCSDEVVMVEVDTVEVQVIVLKEPCTDMDTEMSEATAVMQSNDCQCESHTNLIVSRHDKIDATISKARTYIYNLNLAANDCYMNGLSRIGIA